MSTAGRLRTATLGCVLAAACHSFQRVGPPIVEQSVVRVRFEAPRSVLVVDTSGSRLMLPDVQGVEGRAIAVRRDTLRLALRRVHVRGHWTPKLARSGATTSVALDHVARIDEWRYSPNRTRLAVVGGALGVGAAVVATYVVRFLTADW